MALNGLYCADVLLSNYSLTLTHTIMARTSNSVRVVSAWLQQLTLVSASVLIPTITSIVDRSFSSGQFHPILRESVTSLLKLAALTSQPGRTLTCIRHCSESATENVIRLVDYNRLFASIIRFLK